MGRGKPVAPAIPMTERQKRILTKISQAHTTSQQIAKRVKILLLASEGRSNSSIPADVGTTYNTVLTWRRRWLSEYDKLLVYESGPDGQGITDQKLSKYMLGILKDFPRSGAPKVFTMEQEQQLLALACDKPIDHGLEITDWTHEMLAKTAIAKGIVKTISASHLGKILKK